MGSLFSDKRRASCLFFSASMYTVGAPLKASVCIFFTPFFTAVYIVEPVCIFNQVATKCSKTRNSNESNKYVNFTLHHTSYFCCTYDHPERTKLFSPLWIIQRKYIECTVHTYYNQGRRKLCKSGGLVVLW